MARTKEKKWENPFTPTFGSVPDVFAGRGELVDDVIYGLSNRPGDPNRSTIFIGPRGSGKTALLHTIAHEASQMGWVVVSVSAREGMLEKLRKAVHKEAGHLLGEPVQSNITSVQVGPLALGREVDHSRDQEPWWFDLQCVVEELNAKDVGLMVLIDEIDPRCKELTEFIDEYQHFVSEDRDVALMMAGLPGQVLALFLDEHVSFIRRAFQRRLDPIERIEVEEALLKTIVDNGKTIDDEALDIATRSTRGFALAIQMVGYFLWRRSYGRDHITVEDAEVAAERAAREIAHAVVVPTLQELTAREQEYLLAMSEDEGASSTSEVAKRMGISMTNAANLRRRLIERGVVLGIRMGLIDYAIPSMRPYLREYGLPTGLDSYY